MHYRRVLQSFCERLIKLIRSKKDGCLIRLILVWLTGCCSSAAAAEFLRNDDFSIADTSSMSIDDRLSDQGVVRDSKAASAFSGIRWLVSLGVAHIDTESGERILLTPFELVGRLNPRTSIKIEGDGYGHVRSESGNAHGINNVTFILNRTVFKDEQSRLRLGPGVTVPGGREVGSASSRLRLAASYTRRLNESWEMLAYAKLTRLNREPPAGESRFGQSGLIQAGYTFADAPKTGIASHGVFFHLERDYRSGNGGASLAGLTYEFPFMSNLGGTIVFTRGITSGARDNTVEFDLSFGF